MRHQGLDEDEAYRLMRSTAMSRHLSLGSWRGNCCRLCPPERPVANRFGATAPN